MERPIRTADSRASLPDAGPRTELLSPAGDWDSLRAAVANGADAVYFGLPRFSARQRAVNFGIEDLGEVFRYLHDHNVRGYVAFNTLIFPDELPAASDYVRSIAAAGADAVIVQDVGLARLIGRLVPDLPIHASTQTTQTEPGGISFLEDLGIRRVILARELSLDAILTVSRSTRMELEVFVHGALCVSYSGQCLASEALWGRSANRGLCGQACRLPYQLVVDGRLRPLEDRKFLVSMPDLSTWDLVRKLVHLGVAGLKIEGRLKSAQYVAAATRTYRAALDAALAGKDFRLSPERQVELSQSFSRGFSHGYLDGVDHSRIVHGQFARHLGVRIGRVKGATPRGILVELDPDLAKLGGPIKAGDGVVFDDGRLQQDQQGGRVYAVDRQPRQNRGNGREQDVVRLKFRADEVELSTIPPGTVVWRTDDPGLRRELKKSYSRDLVTRPVGLTFRVRASAGGSLEVEASDPNGHTARAGWEGPLVRADKHPLSIAMLSEQLGRLGTTPFELATLELTGPDGPSESIDVMVPKSVQNDIRRRIVSELMAKREADTCRTIVEPQALDLLREELHSLRGRLSASTPSGSNSGGGCAADARLHVLVRSREQLQAVLRFGRSTGAFGPSTIYLESEDQALIRESIPLVRSAGFSVGLVTRTILKIDETEALTSLAELGPDVVLVRNLGAIGWWSGRPPGPALIGDYSLNVANEVSMGVFLRAGLTRVTASLDLNHRQLIDLLNAFPGPFVEIVIHQRVPIFHMEHCLFAAHLSTGQNRQSCGRPCKTHGLALKDRVHVVHPVVANGDCLNTVFTGHVQSGARYVSGWLGASGRHFRVELFDETAEQVKTLLDVYTRLLSGVDDGEESFRRVAAVYRDRVVSGTFDFE